MHTNRDMPHPETNTIASSISHVLTKLDSLVVVMDNIFDTSLSLLSICTNEVHFKTLCFMPVYGSAKPDGCYTR